MNGSYITRAVTSLNGALAIPLSAADIELLYNENKCFDYVDSLGLSDSDRADVCALLTDYHHS